MGLHTAQQTPSLKQNSTWKEMSSKQRILIGWKIPIHDIIAVWDIMVSK